MSKDQELVKIKRDTKSLVMKNLIVMAVLIIIALTGAISWFTSKTEATADGINVKCEAPDGLEVAIVPHGSTEELEYQSGTIDLTKCKSLSNLFLKLSFEELTSDGRYFYKPKITQNSKGASVDTKSDEPWINAENAYTTNFSVNSSLSYLSVDVYMRSKNAHTIVLGSDTYVKPDSDTLNGAGSGNKSQLGNFSKDCIVGAVRLSTVNSTDSTIKNLWIPAPQIHYNSDNKEVTLNNTSGDTFKHMYWKVIKETGKPQGTTPEEYTGVITNTSNDFKLGENCKFANLTKKESSDKYATDMTTVNIWVDGEDAEARQAMVGGSFTASIKLKISDK